LPVNDEARFQVSVRAPEGTSLGQTRILGERIARAIRKNTDVVLTLVTVGEDNAQTRNLATVYVRLVDPEERKRTRTRRWTGCGARSSPGSRRTFASR